MEFVPALFLAATVKKCVDVARALLSKPPGGQRRDWNTPVTQCIAWGVGVGGALVIAQSSFAEAVEFGGVTLASGNVFDQIIYGVFAASGASVLVDFKKAVDNSDSDSTPPMITPAETGHGADVSPADAPKSIGALPVPDDAPATPDAR